MTKEQLRAVGTVLTDLIPSLIERGITHYYAGGAIGFDLAATVTVLNLKNRYPMLSITLALPCRNHQTSWTEAEKELFKRVLARVDEVVYVNDEYFRGCMRERNCYMVDRSSLCLAYLTTSRGGTYQTVSYAEKEGIEVIRLAPPSLQG